jgi:hypothetical protein
MQRAVKGEAEAQFSQGCLFVSEGDGVAGLLGSGGRSPVADVELALCTAQSLLVHQPRRVDVITG